MSRTGPEAFVLGVGNLLWADEGFGVRCVEQFAAAFDLPDSVEAMDGGTQGLALANILAEAKRVLIFDAVDFDGAPGELVVARGADVPRFVAGKKVSLHQTSMMEVLAVAEFMAGDAPEAITLIGCQPAELEDYGGGLTAIVSPRVAEAVDLAAEELDGWGLTLTQVQQGVQSVMPDAVGWDSYESGRPSAAAACRVGDERVLTRTGQRQG